MSPTVRVDGYAPIEDYAVIGDGRTVALVARDGQVDWWPAPTLDAPPLVAGVLDPDRGGHLSLRPTEPFEVDRRYVEGTNVVETTFTTGTGAITVTDALNTGSAGRLPWTELARRIDCVSGTVTVEWEFAPGNRFGRSSPWVSDHPGALIVTVEDQTVAVITDDRSTVRLDDDDVVVQGRCTLSAGDRAVVALVASDHEPLFVPTARAVDARIQRTIASWRRWDELVVIDPPLPHGSWEPAVRRSALALKTLLTESSGAIAAAATTSLPEGIGGQKNWDYRYAWVRDSSFTLDALINLGLHEEVHGAVSWLLGAIRRNGGRLHVFYSLDGAAAEGQVELDAPGYRHSRPVRAGNTAAGQLQLGTYGDLFDTISRYTAEGHVIDQATGRLLADMADSCCDQWRRRDSGIWELGELRHYTISKIGCWVALNRACQLAAEGQIPDDHVARWRAEGGRIRRWVETHCWSQAKQAYTFYAGSDELDAAVLLAGRTGFDTGARLASTIDAVCSELVRDPLVYRYSGMEEEEGAFVACSFWLVDALARTGQIDRAARLMDQAVALTNDVGLLSEEIDPGTGAFLGNLPQGLSHLALINAAVALRNLSSPERRR